MQIPSEGAIRDLCTGQSFQRGRTYYEQGRIREIEVEDGVVQATVRGTHDYRVTADLTGDHVRTECRYFPNEPRECCLNAMKLSLSV